MVLTGSVTARHSDPGRARPANATTVTLVVLSEVPSEKTRQVTRQRRYQWKERITGHTLLPTEFILRSTISVKFVNARNFIKQNFKTYAKIDVL